MTEYVVAQSSELDDGSRILTELEGREIGVYRLGDDLYAYTSWCPHQGGPACEGAVSGTVRGSFDPDSRTTTLSWTKEDSILYCPWHGWEFDLTTGRCESHPKRRLLSHSVREEDGEILVSL
jgi:nitrite reductase/ring-hydroxylating ferredoxin subunit